MTPPQLDQETYQRWARDLARLRATRPTMNEAKAAEPINVIDVFTMPTGVIIRAIAMSGGSIDLMLNAAGAIHLFRTLRLAGQKGRWMDPDGYPATDPPTDPEEDPLPHPRPHE